MGALTGDFQPVDRDTGVPPRSVDERRPMRHLARFVIKVIEQPDLSAMVKAYRGSRSAAHHPSVLLWLLVHGYATGRGVEPQAGTGDLRFSRVPCPDETRQIP